MKAWSHYSALFLVAAAAACGTGDIDPTNEGAVSLSAKALSSADVAQVKVTITGEGIASPIVASLTKVNGQWQGIVSHIPSGLNRNFHGEAYDNSNALLFIGDAPNVTIAKNNTAAVAITLQQSSAPTPFHNQAPVIDSFVASTNAPGMADPMAVTVTAHDPDPGDTLTYEWQATGGSFSTTSAAGTTWTAPAAEGSQNLTVLVRDQKGAVAAMSFNTNVTAGKGAASVTTGFNMWPVIDQVNASPTRIDIGESTTLSVAASDPDGDPLTWSWTTSCAGSFDNASAASPAFTLAAPLPSGGTCSFSVQVADGIGGTNNGSITVQTGPAATVELAPQVDTAFQSAATAGPGQVVSFQVTAHDPEGTPLTFAWSANVGELGTSVTANGTSQNTWTAPSSVPAGVTPTITATITDQAGTVTNQTFTVLFDTGSGAGCNTDLNTDILNCGSCGTVCTAPAGATPTCNAGKCGYEASSAAIRVWESSNWSQYISLWPDGTPTSGASNFAPDGTPTIIINSGHSWRRTSIFDYAPDLIITHYENVHEFNQNGTDLMVAENGGCCTGDDIYGMHSVLAINQALGRGYLGGTVFDLTSGTRIGFISDSESFISLYENYGYHSGRGRIFKVDYSTNTILWSMTVAPLGTPVVSPVAIGADGSAVAVVVSGQLVRLLPDGTHASWSPMTIPEIPSTQPLPSPVITSGGLIIAQTGAPSLIAVDMSTGAVVWNRSLPHHVGRIVVANNGIVYANLPDDTQLLGLDVATGEVRYTFNDMPNWINTVGGGWVPMADLALRNGVMYASGNKVVAIPVPSMAYDPASPWPAPNHDNQRTCNRENPLTN